MATWAKQKLPRENGELVDMQVPILVSASRSTDIPAFYADWFFYRLAKAGYSAWTNPFNGVKSYVSYKDTRFIVFWSKNPKLIKSLAWYRCSTLMVPCATLSRYRSYHSLGTGTTEVI